MQAKLRTVAALVLAASVSPLHATDERDSHRHGPAPNGPRLEALYQGDGFARGIVTVANPYGAQAGAKILEQGGNAIDAAVAIAYALNVVEPQSAGIGGGGFMLIHLADGRTFSIDSRERAPAGATADMFATLNFTQASTSGISVGVPGMVRGTSMALERYGRLPLRRVIQPAIELADQGFAATARFVSSPNCASAASRARVYPETAAYFCPGGAPIPVGTIVTNKPLAETFRILAQKGPDAFYTGEIAHAVYEGQKRFSAGGKPGSMTMADLEGYEATRRAAVSGTYRGWTIKGMGSPSSGGLTVIQMLKMLERFPLGSTAAGYGFGSANTMNVMAEAMRTAFADRAVWMGDADFSYVPAKGLLHPTYTALRSGPIAPTARMSVNPVAGDPRSYDTAVWRNDVVLAQAEPSFSGPGGSTTHFVVGDRWGNFVSYTNTIESAYGAGMFAGYYPPGCADVSCFKSYGFLLNNELTDFNFVPSTNPFTGQPATNDVAPGKRPRSSMAPTMVFDPRGRLVVAYGSPGGSTIINSVLNVTLNIIDHGMTIQQAIDAPRLSVTSAGGAISIDVGNPSAPTPFDPQVLTALRTLGHTVGAPADIGSVQVVASDPRNGRLYGGADARREGTVIGIGKAR